SVTFSKGKLEALAILLRKLRSDGRRVLIFTQMVKMLDILEAFLDHRKLSYVRVDESFTPEERQRTIQDLFEVEAASGEKVEEFVVLHQEPLSSEAISPRIARPYIQALHSINLDSQEDEHLQQQQQQEEEEKAKEEDEVTGRELAEEGEETPAEDKEEPAYKEELNTVMEQLTPIERYALHYLEYLHLSDDETALKEYVFEAEDGHTEIMPVWTPPTPPQDDNDIYIDSVMMLMYDTTPIPESKLPPVYIRKEHKRLKMDPSGNVFLLNICVTLCLCVCRPYKKQMAIGSFFFNALLYIFPAAARKKKKGHGESVIPPRSLFEKASMLKVRREGKDQKKNFSLKQQAPFAKPLPSLAKPAMEASQDNPEWLISEDWALLQVITVNKRLQVQIQRKSRPSRDAGKHAYASCVSEYFAVHFTGCETLLELPLNLNIVSPAHTPNWDLVSDVVNSCSRIYRSPKQCRNRYENVIIPREEGKVTMTHSLSFAVVNSRLLLFHTPSFFQLVYEANPKKKTKSIYKTKNSRPLRTCQIYTQDDNAMQMQLYNNRFELMKIIASKRSPPIKPLLGMNPFQKNPKHASVLAESGINYDKPLPPIQVASQRAERIAKEKKALAEQQKAQSLCAEPAAGWSPTGAGGPRPDAGSSRCPSPGSGPPGRSRGRSPRCGQHSRPATVGGNVIVNTVAGVPQSPFQANKRLASPVIPGTLSVGPGPPPSPLFHSFPLCLLTVLPTCPACQRGRSPGGARAEKGRDGAAPAEVVAIAAGQGVRAVAPATASAVVSTTLSPAQSQARPMVTQVTPVAAAAQSQQVAGTLPAAQVQAAQANPQLTAVAAPRAGTVLTGTTVANLQVARLTLEDRLVLLARPHQACRGVISGFSTKDHQDPGAHPGPDPGPGRTHGPGHPHQASRGLRSSGGLLGRSHHPARHRSGHQRGHRPGPENSHHSAPTRHQDPVFHHRVHRSEPESHRSPADPGVCRTRRRSAP
ncbi:unnamed protein product, partial [Tetraodon nigroviridis]